MYAHLRDLKAFTLLELIVVIVILAILAAIAIPTFEKVMIRTKDEKGLIELAAAAREATALAAITQEGDTNVALNTFLDSGTAVAAAPGVYAGTTQRKSVAYDTQNGGQASYTPAERADNALVASKLGMVSHANGYFSVAADSADPSFFGLAMRSEHSPHCVFVTYRGAGLVGTGIKDWTADGATACKGGVAFTVATPGGPGSGGGSTDSTTPTDGSTTTEPAPADHTEISLVNPIPDPAFPIGTGTDPADPANPAKKTTTNEPITPGTDLPALPADAVAVASFPSGHASGDHHIFVLLSDGSIVDVVDTGTCAATASCVSRTVYPAGTFAGGVSMVAGARPETSGTANEGVLKYDTLYVGSTSGTVTSVSRAGGAWTAPVTVASGLTFNMFGVTAIAYAACLDTAGAATAAHCVYAAGGNAGKHTWYQVDVAGGTPVTRTLGWGQELTGIVPVMRNGALVFALSGSDGYDSYTWYYTPAGTLVTGGSVWMQTTKSPSSATAYQNTLYVGDAGDTTASVKSLDTSTDTAGTVPTAGGVRGLHNHGLPGELYAIEDDGCVHKLAGGSDQKLTCEPAPTGFFDAFNRSDRSLTGDNGWQNVNNGSSLIKTEKIGFGAYGNEQVMDWGTAPTYARNEIFDPAATGLVTVEADVASQDNGYDGGGADVNLFIGMSGTFEDVGAAYDNGVRLQINDGGYLDLAQTSNLAGSQTWYFYDHGLSDMKSNSGVWHNFKLTYNPATRVAVAYMNGHQVMTLTTTGTFGPLVGFGHYWADPYNGAYGDGFIRDMYVDNFRAHQQ